MHDVHQNVLQIIRNESLSAVDKTVIFINHKFSWAFQSNINKTRQVIYIKTYFNTVILVIQS